MQFAYDGAITGGQGSKLTNYGTIEMTNGNVAVLVNGDGVLRFDGYHDAYGHSVISAPVTAAQTVELSTAPFGMQMTLTDPGDFHALVKLIPNSVGTVLTSVVLDGVHADSFSILPSDRVMLTNGGRAVDLLRVADAGSVPITASYGADSTTLTFHTNPLSS